MKSLMRLLKSLYGAVISALIVLSLIIGVFPGNREAEGAIVAVKRGAISEEVFVTGKIQSAREAKLAFERGGKVSSVTALIGDRVSAGQILAKLEAADLAAELEEANANIKIQEIKLNELKTGARPEEIQIQESRIVKLRDSLAQALKDLAFAVNESYTNADDAVRNKIDQLFIEPFSSVPKLKYALPGQLKNDIEFERYLIEPELRAWYEFLTSSGVASKISGYAETAGKNLSRINSILNKLALAINGFTPFADLSQAAIDNYKSMITTARNSLHASIAKLQSAGEKIAALENDLEIAGEELLLKKSGGTEDQIAAQEAQVTQAKARAKNIEAQIAKTAIRSPISGILTRNDAEAGEIVSPNEPLITVMSLSDLEIEANMPEVDIGKISAGNPTLITLDAFPREKFLGKIIFIDPAETIIDGVVNFKIKIAFEEPDSRLKSGLTANLTIEISKKDGVLIVPLAAVIEKDSGAFVKKIDRGAEREIPVTTGIRSQTANLIEIISGLREGEKILNAGLKSENQ